MGKGDAEGVRVPEGVRVGDTEVDGVAEADLEGIGSAEAPSLPTTKETPQASGSEILSVYAQMDGSATEFVMNDEPQFTYILRSR